METAPAVPTALPLPPGPGTLSRLSNLAAFRRDVLGLLPSLAAKYGDVVRVPLGPRDFYFLFHPEPIRHVLQDNARHYTKQTPGFNVMRELLGQGLLTSEGDFWLRQRRLAQPAFHKQRIAGFGRLMVDAARELADEWTPHLGSGQPVDVAGGMMRLTLRIAGEALFSADVTREADGIREALDVVQHYANHRITHPFHPPRWVPTPLNRRATRARDLLDGVVLGIIERRRREGGTREDLLSLLMEARDADTGEAMSDAQLRDEVMTLLLAGHETTATALSWTWTLLARHPEARRALEAELAEVLGGREPTVEDVPRLTFTRRVLDESMRLYPPAWLVSRQAAAEDAVGGYRIPAGAVVVVSPWVTHRHPVLWENPEAFEPERFRPERAAALPRFGYFPFGGGPRQCIGNGFALLELTLVLATLAQRLRLELVPGRLPAPEPTITLRPRGGLWMTASPV